MVWSQTDAEQRTIAQTSTTQEMAELLNAFHIRVRQPIFGQLQRCQELVRKNEACITETCALDKARRVVGDVGLCFKKQHEMVLCTQIRTEGINTPQVEACLKELP